MASGGWQYQYFPFLFAGSTIITNQGVVVYSGTPALGDVAVSIASVQFTDGFGNIIPKGFGLSIPVSTESAVSNAAVFGVSDTTNFYPVVITPDGAQWDLAHNIGPGQTSTGIGTGFGAAFVSEQTLKANQLYKVSGNVLVTPTTAGGADNILWRATQAGGLVLGTMEVTFTEEVESTSGGGIGVIVNIMETLGQTMTGSIVGTGKARRVLRFAGTVIGTSPGKFTVHVGTSANTTLITINGPGTFIECAPIFAVPH